MITKDDQHRIINAVEKAKSARLATGQFSMEYDRGYHEAKRDILIELTKVFAGEDDAP